MAGQPGQPQYGSGWPDGLLAGLGQPGHREARPLLLIDYSYFYTQIVISCDQRSVKRLNFQYNIKITTHF